LNLQKEKEEKNSYARRHFLKERRKNVISQLKIFWFDGFIGDTLNNYVTTQTKMSNIV
jgi:hypothetical protein